MTAHVRLEELVAAYEWVSAGEAAAADCEAYVSRVTGAVHWSGEGVDEELPEDIEDESLYIAVPHKSEFGLGRSLALRFAEEHLSASYDVVRGYFRKGDSSHCLKMQVNLRLGINMSKLQPSRRFVNGAKKMASTLLASPVRSAGIFIPIAGRSSVKAIYAVYGKFSVKLLWTRSHPPSSGRLPSGFACWKPPLMSNVRPRPSGRGNIGRSPVGGCHVNAVLLT